MIGDAHHPVVVQIAPAPGAGAQHAFVVPAGRKWRVLSVDVRLITDATVANRELRLIFDDGTQVLFQSQNDVGQTASTGVEYTWAPGLGIGEVATAASDSRQYASPDTLLLAGHRIRTAVVGMQAGDTLSNLRATVEDMPHL